jgi:hypothetical protein
VALVQEAAKAPGTKYGAGMLFLGDKRESQAMLVIGTFVGTLCIGTLLGLRFKVFVLVPAILIAACLIIATGDGLKAIAFTIFASAVTLQTGYALGLVVRVLAARHLWARNKPRYRFSKSRRVGTLFS